MELGAVFPTNEIGNDPIAIRDFAQTAEGLGYGRIVTFDHVLGAPHEGRQPPLKGPYTHEHAFHEPMVLFGYLAAVTTTIKLETGVLVLPQRQTALVAKQAAQVDVLSSGRLILGVGIGWNHVEYECLGEDFRTKAPRMEEQVALLRRFWAEPVVDFTGRWHRIDRAGILPLPTERRIPVWFGGYADVALARSARIGDGHIFSAVTPELGDAARRFKEHLEAAGRTLADAPMERFVAFGHGPQMWAEQAVEWESVGGTVLTVRTLKTSSVKFPDAGLDSPAAHIAALATFAKAMRG